MSVSLTPINDPDGESLNVSNVTWDKLCLLAAPAVKPWNGYNDLSIYTPEELRAIAAVVPDDWKEFKFAERLEALAQAGGDELS
jgi:hypothetical protein